jgi:hypothetical protein
VLFKDDEKSDSKVTTYVKEACIRVDSGFELVTGEYNDDGKIFKAQRLS